MVSKNWKMKNKFILNTTYHEIHISKGHNHEDYLRDKFEYKIKPLSEIEGVTTFQYNSHRHLYDS